MRHVVDHPVDRIASRLAAEAGIVWSQLSEHPGYQRYIWREKALALLTLAGEPVAPMPAAPERAAPAPRFLSE